MLSIDMMNLTFKSGLHTTCDVWSSQFLSFDQNTVYLGYFLPPCYSWQFYMLCAWTSRFLSFLPLILILVPIIRDNRTSPLNHCDLVYSVSLACSTPLFHFYHFNNLFLSLPLSHTMSLNSSISIASATQEFNCSLRLSFSASPSVSFSSPPPL